MSGECVTANVFGYDAFDRVCWDIVSLSKESRDQYDALLPLLRSVKEAVEEPLADDNNINHTLRNVIYAAASAKVSVLSVYVLYVQLREGDLLITADSSWPTTETSGRDGDSEASQR